MTELPQVTQVVAEAHAQYGRFHDVFDGLTWRLCRDPIPTEAVEIAPSTYIIRSGIHPYPGFCQIVLIYSLDGDGTINLDEMKIEPNPDATITS